MKNKSNREFLKKKKEKRKIKQDIKNSPQMGHEESIKKMNDLWDKYEDKPAHLPVKNSDDILLDTMMISHILVVKNDYDEDDKDFRYLNVKFNKQESENIVEKIKKRLLKYNSKLILLDRIEKETISMKYTKYNKTYTNENIEDALFEIGNYEKIKVDYLNKEIIDAERIYLEEEYKNPNTAEPLSLVDCILLKVHVTQALLSRPASLFTSDATLQKATLSEGRGTMGIDGVGIRFGDKEEVKRMEQERLEDQGIEGERLDVEKMKQERLDVEKMKQEKLDEKNNSLRIRYRLCPKCKINYIEGNKCPKCKK
ncbi:MAG: hypothetical protein H8D35_02825 [Nitrosopumilus sp.]|nr:hypothetical protein [Nitrosopumilus sp.]